MIAGNWYTSICSLVCLNLFTSIPQFVHWFLSFFSMVSHNFFDCMCILLYIYLEFIHQYPEFVYWYPWISSLVSIILFTGISHRTHTIFSLVSLNLTVKRRRTIVDNFQQRFLLILFINSYLCLGEKQRKPNFYSVFLIN